METVTVCKRCESLRHCGRIKSPSVEPLLASFDFDRVIFLCGPPSSPSSSLTLADFHGSFPSSLSCQLHSLHLSHSDNHKHDKPSNLPCSLLVLTGQARPPPLPKAPILAHKAPIFAPLPRCRPLFVGVHIFSAVKNWGIKPLVEKRVADVGDSSPLQTGWRI